MRHCVRRLKRFKRCQSLDFQKQKNLKYFSKAHHNILILTKNKTLPRVSNMTCPLIYDMKMNGSIQSIIAKTKQRHIWSNFCCVSEWCRKTRDKSSLIFSYNRVKNSAKSKGFEFQTDTVLHWKVDLRILSLLKKRLQFKFSSQNFSV